MPFYLSLTLQVLLIAIASLFVVVLIVFWRRREAVGPVAISSGVVALLSLFFGTLCVGHKTGFLGDKTPACPGVTVPLPAVAAQIDRNPLLTCGNNSLTFHEADVHGANDIQFLDTLGGGRAVPGGPLAAIYPEVNIHRNVDDIYYEGRIVAKVWVDPNSSGYPKLGLGPGINYIWIDTVSPPPPRPRQVISLQDQPPGYGLADPSPRGGQLIQNRYRAVIIPSDPNTPVSFQAVNYYEHRKEDGFKGYNQAYARWIYYPLDAAGWMDCTKYGCCAVGDS